MQVKRFKIGFCRLKNALTHGRKSKRKTPVSAHDRPCIQRSNIRSRKRPRASAVEKRRKQRRILRYVVFTTLKTPIHTEKVPFWACRTSRDKLSACAAVTSHEIRLQAAALRYRARLRGGVFAHVSAAAGPQPMRKSKENRCITQTTHMTNI